LKGKGISRKRDIPSLSGGGGRNARRRGVTDLCQSKGEKLKNKKGDGPQGGGGKGIFSRRRRDPLKEVCWGGRKKRCIRNGGGERMEGKKQRTSFEKRGFAGGGGGVTFLLTREKVPIGDLGGEKKSHCRGGGSSILEKGELSEKKDPIT